MYALVVVFATTAYAIKYLIELFSMNYVAL